MAVAAWLVWKRGGFARQQMPLSLFLIQLFQRIYGQPAPF